VAEKAQRNGTGQGADFNDRETGARNFQPMPGEIDRDRIGAIEQVQEPRHKQGLRQPVNETFEKTRQSDHQGLHTGDAHGETGTGAED
jgi:hypothetical protein